MLVLVLVLVLGVGRVQSDRVVWETLLESCPDYSALPYTTYIHAHIHTSVRTLQWGEGGGGGGGGVETRQVGWARGVKRGGGGEVD